MSTYSRRDFAKLSAVALAGASLLPVVNPLRAEVVPVKPLAQPNSKVAGVQIGINVPYSFGEPAMSGDDILKNCLQLGLSAVELRAQPIETFLGAPTDLIFAKKGADAANNAKQLAAWRKSASLERAVEFRKTYEAAGVLIEVVKVDKIFELTDDELDYVFKLAKAVGGRAISTEISTKEDELKRVGEFADKHKFMVGYHGHTHTGPKEWEKAFSLAKYNGANVDIGHFVAGYNDSPVPFIKEHHERITHVHIKDRKMAKNGGDNMPFGEGETPIKDVLHLLRDNKWNIMATIEFEYKVPAGSTRMAEIAKAITYCKDALT